MLKSGWIIWEMGAVDGDDDRLVTSANAVGLTFLIRGSVRVDWECFGQQKSAVFSTGMSEFRPADGHEHRYRHRWAADSAALCVQIPAGQLALMVAGDGTRPPIGHRHVFAFHDPVVDHCMRSLATRRSNLLDSIDEDAISRVLLIRLVELQGLSSPRWISDSDPLPRATMLRIRDFVDSHLSAAIDLASMARIAGLSRGHFARTFRQTLGMSPGDFIRVRRVKAAFEKIVNGDESLGKIAETVGFSSQGHLSFAFLRVTGLTPGFARRRALRPMPISRLG